MSTAVVQPQPPDPRDPRGPRAGSADAETLLRAGTDALAERRWEDARAAFEVAARENRPDAWEGLGFACWGLQDAEPMFAARAAAYRLYRALGKVREAARVAAALANDHLDFRGEGAVANGWLRRAERLLADVDAEPERAWLSAWQARLALVTGRDEAEVLSLIERAIELGRAAGIPDVEGLALALHGMTRVAAGDVHDGMAELDEATVAALSGDMQDPYTIGVTCCYLIAACERTRDYDRAGQWCQQLRAYCERQRLAVVLTNCRLQYASVLMARGDWATCERELAAALDDAERARVSLLAAARARLGELRRRQGRVEEARELFAAAGNHSTAMLGGAALDLDEDQPAAAAERLELYLRRVRPDAAFERALGLELLARLEAQRGDAAAALAALDELDAIAARYAAPSVAAAAHAGRGFLAATQGDDGAPALLEDAADRLARLGLPFEAAASRLRLARALRAAGREPAARDAARAARDGFRELGSTRARDAEALLARGRTRTGRDTSGPLTRREVQVLRLVADGLSNREIAGRLVVSPHTVHRHLSNIRRKLAVGSRSAAVARALREGIL